MACHKAYNEQGSPYLYVVQETLSLFNTFRWTKTDSSARTSSPRVRDISGQERRQVKYSPDKSLQSLHDAMSIETTQVLTQSLSMLKCQLEPWTTSFCHPIDNTSPPTQSVHAEESEGALAFKKIHFVSPSRICCNGRVGPN